MNFFDEYDKKVDSTVLEHGHAVQLVGPGDGCPPCGYTVGRASVGRPELFLIGPLPLDVIKTILNNACEVDNDTPLAPGVLIERVLDGYPVRVIEADPRAAEMFVALKRDPNLKALQVLWPNIDGKFPDEPEWSLTSQPLFPVGRTS